MVQPSPLALCSSVRASVACGGYGQRSSRIVMRGPRGKRSAAQTMKLVYASECSAELSYDLPWVACQAPNTESTA